MKKKEEITLVPEQEVAIDDFYEDKGVTAIKELVGLIFPNIDEKFRDGRSVYGKAIKNYLASKGKKAISFAIFFLSEALMLFLSIPS